MSRFPKSLLCAAAISALPLGAAPATAQTIDRIVAFGDSYADDGNLFELLGIPRPAVYANGRFSNGTNFVDTLSQILAVPVDNFAIGGAFTGNGNINGPGIPGFVTEYQSFLAGGGPAAFPRVNGRFAPNDLVVVSVGGNDARAYERSLGLTPTAAQIATLNAGAPAQAAQRVAEATTGLNALVGAGARNITFLVGDVGRLPEVRGLPVAAVGTTYANAFNAGIQSSLREIASRGVIVNYLDLSQIGNVVEANLSAFNLTSAGACPIACVTTDPSLLDRYLFYVDQLHLTSRGFEIVGQYAARQLEAPLHFQAQTDAALLAATSFGSTLSGRLDLSAARGGGDGDGLHFFIAGNSASRDFGRSDTNLGYELDTFGVTAGAEYDRGGAIFGAALNWSKPEGNMATGTGAVRTEARQIGVYGAWAGGGAFVQAWAGMGWLDMETSREAVIDTISGEADGTSVTAGGKAGFLLDAGAVHVGPVVGIHYAKAEIDGFTETGDPVLTLNVEEQDLKALVGSAGVEMRGEFDSGGLAVRPYLSLTAEKDFEGDGRVIRYAGTAAPGIVNSFVLPGRSKHAYGRVTGGASLSLGGAVSLQLQGSTSFEQEGSEDMGGLVALKLGF
jgi:outer membrane lipase/esterase